MLEERKGIKKKSVGGGGRGAHVFSFGSFLRRRVPCCLFWKRETTHFGFPYLETYIYIYILYPNKLYNDESGVSPRTHTHTKKEGDKNNAGSVNLQNTIFFEQTSVESKAMFYLLKWFPLPPNQLLPSGV